MSEFDELRPPTAGEMPSPEKLREMLEQHAFEAAKLLAQQGALIDADTTRWCNYGEVDDIQLRIEYLEGSEEGSNEQIDLHQASVDWRPKQANLAVDEEWDDYSIHRDRMLFYDHTRPGNPNPERNSKNAIEMKPATNPDEIKLGRKYQFEEVGPEGIAYIDTLLTRLVSEQ